MGKINVLIRSFLKIIRNAFDYYGPLIGPKKQNLERVTDVTAGSFGLRIYKPHSQEKVPVLLFYHGGAWVLGSIKAYDHICQYLSAKAGYVVVSVEYRLLPEYPFPAALDDAINAFKWVSQHISSYGGDKGKIIVAGDSAGGYLASMVVQCFPFPNLRAQVLIYPVLNLRLLENFSIWHKKILNYVFPFFNGDYSAELTHAKNLKISQIIPKNSQYMLSTYIIKAEWDILNKSIDEYIFFLQKYNFPFICKMYKNATHGFLQFFRFNRKAQRALKELVQYLSLLAEEL